MRLTRGSAILAGAVMMLCLAPACSSLLGLNDYKDAKADAGSTGGAGGTAGKDAGGDANDAGSTFHCDPQGTIFDVLKASELSNAAVDGESLIVVDGASATPGDNHYTYVVLTDDLAGTQNIVVRSIEDSFTSRLGNMVAYNPSQQFKIKAGYADQTHLHVLGRTYTDLVDVSFPLGNNAQPGMPTEVPLFANACPNGIQRSCFAREGSTVHTLVTCNEPTPDGGPWFSLYLDGALVDSGPDTNYELDVQDCTMVGSTLVMSTSTDPGYPLLRYGQSAKELQQTHPFKLTTDSTRATGIGAMIPTPAADGLVVLGMTYVPKAYVPIDGYAGVVPLKSFADLETIPVPELLKQLTITKLAQVYLNARGDVGPDFNLFAGPSMDLSSVGLTVLDNGGNLLDFGIPVYGADLTKSSVAAAAVGRVRNSIIVVWAEQDAGGGNERIRGQAMICSSG